MEYIVGFALTLAVIIVGLQLLGSGIQHILHPEPAMASGGMLVILGVTAAMKLWLSGFNSRIADCTDNVAVRASALDARSDALVTLMTIAALLLEQTGSRLPFDGLAGLLVSVFILRAGVSMGRDVINRILGQPLPQEDRDHIVRILREEPEILDIHDLEVHDYGPARRMGSVHAEVRADMSLLEAHRAVDRAEQRIMDELGIRMTIHADPYDGTDPRTFKYRQLVQAQLQAMDSGISYHDLRLDDKEEPPVLSFDVVIPYGCSLGTEEITEQLRDALAADDIQLMITFDSGDPNEKTDHLAYK
jgi:cation diffusion facilitator family transporter